MNAAEPLNENLQTPPSLFFEHTGTWCRYEQSAEIYPHNALHHILKETLHLTLTMAAAFHRWVGQQDPLLIQAWVLGGRVSARDMQLITLNLPY
jgi:hypothetical protein